MADHLECPHCRSTLTATLSRNIVADVEFIAQGFTHYCTRCFDKHGNQAPAHFFVDDDGGVFMLPPRPEGVRVEIDEAEMAVTDNVHKIPEMAGRLGAAAAKAGQAIADAAVAAGLSSEALQAFGQACHGAGIGKPIEVAVDSSGNHEATVIAAEEIARGQCVYLDDDGKARVMRAADPAPPDAGFSIGGKAVACAFDVTLTIDRDDIIDTMRPAARSFVGRPDEIAIAFRMRDSRNDAQLAEIVQACHDRTALKDVRLHGPGCSGCLSEAYVVELARETVSLGGNGCLCEFEWRGTIKPAPGVELVMAEDDEALPEHGSTVFLPEGWTVQPLPDDLVDADYEFEDDDDDDYLPDPDEIDDMFDEAFEEVNRNRIPTERDFAYPDEADAPSGTARAAVWLFKAGASTAAGAGIVWAIRQLVKGLL